MVNDNEISKYIDQQKFNDRTKNALKNLFAIATSKELTLSNFTRKQADKSIEIFDAHISTTRDVLSYSDVSTKEYMALEESLKCIYRHNIARAVLE